MDLDSSYIDELVFNKIALIEIIDLGIVVATQVELDAVLATLSPFENQDSIFKIAKELQTYYVGVFGEYPVCVVKSTMMGALKRDSSHTTVADCISHWNLKAVIMLGIAFGKDSTKQAIGDILVCETLTQYESSKIDTQKGVISRGFSVNSSPTLLNRFTQTESWLKTNSQTSVSIYKSEILTGEKLINDVVFRDSLFQRFPNASGGEMEGSGVYAACDRSKIDWIICKSICDWADGNKDDAWQALAASNVVGYVEEILSQGKPLNDIGIKNVSSADYVSFLGNEFDDDKQTLGYEILSIIYANHRIEETPHIQRQSKGIFYNYFEVKITEQMKLAYLFFPKGIRLENSIKHFFNNCDSECSSLVVCSPRVISQNSGRDDYRLNNIEKIFSRHNHGHKLKSIEYEYIEDLVWRHCIELRSSKLDFDIPPEKHFIDQAIQLPNVELGSNSVKSLGFFNSLIKQESISKPLVAILGGAGAGKTTLCDTIANSVSGMRNKKSIYISSSDFESDTYSFPISSVKDLFVAYTSLNINQEESGIDPQSLVVNLCCGNIILIVDGLDEIESKLKESFDFDAFVYDAHKLNETYNNCLILITSRDYYKAKYMDVGHIEVITLLGFDDILANKYFIKRFDNEPKEVRRAEEIVKDLNLADAGYYPPGLLSLVCDVVESERNLPEIPDDNLISEYLIPSNALDKLIIKIINREIRRQGLSMTVDDVIDILFELARNETGELLKQELNSYLSDLNKNSFQGDYSSFYVNPLLSTSSDKNRVKFRYDSVVLLLRSRYFLSNIQNSVLNSNIVKPLLLKFYDGRGNLLEDILDNNSLNEDELLNTVRELVESLVKELNSLMEKQKGAKFEIEFIKKCISASLYLYFSSNTSLDRTERMKKLLYIYSGKITGLFIYGKFFPLDFSSVSIHDSGFYNYEEFEKSKFPLDNTIFYSTDFQGINPKGNLGTNNTVFDQSCSLNIALRKAACSEELTRNEILLNVRLDFIIVLGTLFRERRFFSKSENVFKTKNKSIKSRFTVDNYLNYFLTEGVFTRERSAGTGSKFHYSIHIDYRDDVRYFLTNNNFQVKLNGVYNKFIEKVV